MTFLEDLAKAAGNSTAVWHRFVVSHEPMREEWYVFVEGRLDTPFYTAAIRNVLGHGTRVVDFRCQGKEGVRQACVDVRRSHPRCTRALFFMDKDLDDFLTDYVIAGAEVFETDVYSIENYFVSGDALEAVWQQIWALSTADQMWSRVSERFALALKSFHRLMLPISAWIVAARAAGCRPNLNNVRMASIVKLADGLPVLCKHAFAELRKDASCEFRPSLRDWLSMARAMRSSDSKCVTRGKFELWFFCRFLDAIRSQLQARQNERPATSIALAPESLATALIGKIAVPPTLSAFIEIAGHVGRDGHCGRKISG